MKIQKIKYSSERHSYDWIRLKCEVVLETGEAGSVFEDIKDDLDPEILKKVKAELFVKAYQNAIGQWGAENGEEVTDDDEFKSG